MLDIRTYIQQAIAEAVKDRIVLDSPAELEIPRNPGFGDLSSNIAMHLAKPLKQNPRLIAEEIVLRLKLNDRLIAKVEIAGAGFINFTYAEAYLRTVVNEILREKKHYGASNIGKGKRVNLEFVSANPTGPLNIVSARAAALGDSLKRLLNFCGYRAESEFYVNDAGKQIEKLGQSVMARYAELKGIKSVEFPEEGYKGEYIKRIAEKYTPSIKINWDNISDEVINEVGLFAIRDNVAFQNFILRKFGVCFDRWFYESSIRAYNKHLDSKIYFERHRFTYIKENAIYFKSTEFGDDEDRVIWTSDGRPTYFLPDIAYHQDKYDRGFEWLIDIWGPDHHGYVPRMKAALQALGHDPDSFTVIIAQQVNLLRGGEKVKMSKRAGEIVTMDELIDEVGSDAARFFFLQRKASAHLDFDLDLAVKQSEENPVFYVQYAHARICSIERYSEDAGISGKPIWEKLAHPAEFALIRKMTEFPLTVELCVKALEPQRLTVYLGELAAAFHSFYQKCRVVTEDKELSAARLGLCLAVRQVIANGLNLLGVSAPESM